MGHGSATSDGSSEVDLSEEDDSLSETGAKADAREDLSPDALAALAPELPSHLKPGNYHRPAGSDCQCHGEYPKLLTSDHNSRIDEAEV